MVPVNSNSSSSSARTIALLNGATIMKSAIKAQIDCRTKRMNRMSPPVVVINSWCDVLSIGTAERASAEVGNNRAAIGNTNDDDLVMGPIPSSGAVNSIHRGDFGPENDGL